MQTRRDRMHIRRDRATGKLKNRPALNYVRLVRLSEKIGMPQNYVEDLTKFDKESLQEEDPDTFYWIARQNGTEFILDRFWEDEKSLELIRIKLVLHPEALAFKITEDRIQEIDRQIFFWNPEEIEERLNT